MIETMRGGRFSSLVRHLVDLAIVRLRSIAAHMEQEIRGGNPAFDQHRVEDHGAGYRAAPAFVSCAARRPSRLVTRLHVVVW